MRNASPTPRLVQTALIGLGANLKTARLRRGLTRDQVAQALVISPDTYRRVEIGQGNVAVGIYLGALNYFQMLAPAFDLALPQNDAEGKILEAKRQPQRGSARRRTMH